MAKFGNDGGDSALPRDLLFLGENVRRGRQEGFREGRNAVGSITIIGWLTDPDVSSAQVTPENLLALVNNAKRHSELACDVENLFHHRNAIMREMRHLAAGMR
ncbi:hypothetical protein ANO14919_040390 [Xylariales sp. No.14919]|nr:hypothetical protein ANO14919_040390 [Xylariales sp. No.14919]